MAIVFYVLGVVSLLFAAGVLIEPPTALAADAPAWIGSGIVTALSLLAVGGVFSRLDRLIKLTERADDAQMEKGGSEEPPS